MSIIKTSIKQPVLVNLLFALVLVAGVVYGGRSTKELFPDVTAPGLFVQTIYPGIASTEIEKLVTRPLEDAVADVEGVAHIYSTSYESLSFLWLELEPDADMDKAVLDVQARVNETRRELPPDIENPLVRAARMQMPVIQVALLGVSGGDPHQFRRVAKALKERLENLQQMDEVTQSGIEERQIRVVVDPVRLEAYGVGIGQVAQTLRARNRNLPGGTIRTGAREYVVRAIAEYQSLDDLREAVVVKRSDGRHIRIRHLATVQDTFKDRDRGGWVDGQPGVVLGIIKQKGADGHKVAERVRAAVSEFQKSLPKGYAIKLMGDTTREVDRSMSVLYRNGAFGIGLVLALLWLFLGFRNAIFAALGIPFALAGGIVVMYVLGVSINQLSLFALIICVGIIVDDAIVVVENTYRYLEQGKPASVAALLGAKEVMWPVISTILTTIAAFLPLLLMTGVFGKFMAVIPKVVVAALAASLIEALIVLPSHVADFGKASGRAPGEDGRVLAVLKRAYRATFRPVLKLRYLAFLMAWAAVIGLVVLAARYKEVVLFGEEDADMVDIRIEMPQGSSLAATEKVVRQVEAIARREVPAKELEAVLSQSGWSRTHLWPQVGKHLGMVTLMLKPATSRNRTAQQIVSHLRARLKDIPGPVRPLELLPLQFGPPKGKPVAIRISGENLERLLQLAEKVESEIAKIEGVKDVGRDYHLGSPEFRLRVNESKAALHGLGTADVAAVVTMAYMGLEVSKYRERDEEIDVVVRYPEGWRNDPERLTQIRLALPPGASGGAGGGAGGAAALLGLGAGTGAPGAVSPSLTIGDVAVVERGQGPTAIQRRDRQRTITVTANLDSTAGTTSQGANRAAQRRLRALVAANPDVRFEFGGEFEKTNESLQSLGVAFLVAMFVIYLILGAQFRSFVQPLVVLFAVPLSVTGVIVGFFVSGNPIDMIALIGVVGLAGIVVNDSLILVDFINQRRRLGMPRNEAIEEAGALRLRPILLTSITTVGGLMPMSLGWGGDSAGLSPMATAIAWGLSFATVLTLYIVPATYAIVDDAVNGVFRLFGSAPRWVRPDLDALDELDRLSLDDAERRAEVIFPGEADPPGAGEPSPTETPPGSPPAA